MKFSDHLLSHLTPEWHKQYVSYETMKRMLYRAVEDAPSIEFTDVFVIEVYYARFADEFFLLLDKELNKVNNFFLEKLAEAARKFSNLEFDLSMMIKSKMKHQEKNVAVKRYSVFDANKEEFNMADRHKSLRKIKFAFSEFYLSLVLLQNYQTLNFQGMKKICRKHDKLTKSSRGTQWFQSNVEVAPFYTCKEVNKLIKEVEVAFTRQLEGGDRQRTMKKLRVPPLGDKLNIWTTFRVGLFVGAFFVLSLLTLCAGYMTWTGPDAPSSSWRAALQMYRGFFLLCLFIFLLGLNTYAWRAAGVNHVLIFQLDPRDHLTHDQLIEVASFLALICTCSVLSYLLSHYMHIPAFTNPVCLLLTFILYFVNPFPIMHYKARMWLLKVLFCIVTAPFHHVEFADFWLADQLNSLAPILLDFEFLVCFYATEIDWFNELQMKGRADKQWSRTTTALCSGPSNALRPVLACLPAWFRFAQCLRRYRDTRLFFPHIANAAKYATTFLVVLFSTLHKSYAVRQSRDGGQQQQHNVFFYLWMMSAVVNSCCSLAWDLKMDWGLMEAGGGKNFLLREETVYPRKSFYYLAIIENILLRFSWIWLVYIQSSKKLDQEIARTIVSSLEVFRRFVWNFLRLENEHLNNCGQFRAVRDISVAPMNDDDHHLLLHMMDGPDGVCNRRKPKGQQTGQQEEEKEPRVGICTYKLVVYGGNVSNDARSNCPSELFIGAVDEDDDEDDDTLLGQHV